MTGITQKLSFKAYFEKLKKEPTELRDKICATLNISEKTFYNKFNSNGFDYPQQVVISEILERPIHELFPTPEKVA